MKNILIALVLASSGCASVTRKVPLAGRPSKAGLDLWLDHLRTLSPDDLVLTIGQPTRTQLLPNRKETWTYDWSTYADVPVIARQKFDWNEGRAVTVTTGGGERVVSRCEVTFVVDRKVEKVSAMGEGCNRLFVAPPRGHECLRAPRAYLLVGVAPTPDGVRLRTVPQSRWEVREDAGYPPKFPRLLSRLAVCGDSPDGPYMFYAPSSFMVPLEPIGAK
jgi:hypothetical protein